MLACIDCNVTLYRHHCSLMLTLVTTFNIMVKVTGICLVFGTGSVRFPLHTSTFLPEVATSETVQLLTSDSMSTNVVPFQPPVSPTVCKPSLSNPHFIDHTYSTIPNGTQKVVLLASSGQAVGIGSIAEGNMLHGQPVPAGYTKVVIEYVQPGTVPMLSTDFDSEELCTGQFTAWPTDCIMYDS